MTKPKNNTSGNTTPIDYRDKYSESKPKEMTVNIPEDLVSGIEEYRQYLGECAGINTSLNKIVAESIKDTLSEDNSFRLWREKKIRESAQKNKSTALPTLGEVDIDKTFEELKTTQNAPAKSVAGNVSQNGATAGAGAAVGTSPNVGK